MAANQIPLHDEEGNPIVQDGQPVSVVINDHPERRIAYLSAAEAGKASSARMMLALASAALLNLPKDTKMVSVTVDELSYVPTVAPPPDKLSIDPNHPDFHPCYVRVGVRVNGEERSDLQFYDVKWLEFQTLGDKSMKQALSIEPYWRYTASRQQRRLEERWKGKRK